MPINSFDNYPMSWKPTLDKNTHSLYKLLAKQLEDDIMNGFLKPGTKLPPQRELADFLDINVSTVSKAFKLCELKGLLSAAVGSGTFVSYDALTNGRLVLDGQESHIIDMGATVPEPSSNEILMKLLKEMVAENDAERLFHYNAAITDQWQKDTAVQLFQYCGHTTSNEQILLAVGGQNALSAILSAGFKQGDKIAVDDHTYPGIKSAAAMYGIQLFPVPQQKDGIDVEMLEVLCKNEKIQGVYLIPASHNPTTVSIPPYKRKQIAQVIAKYNLLLIEDGTYQLMETGITSISDYVKDRSIYFVSVSKAIAPGLRIAYLSVPTLWKQPISDALYSLNVSVVPMMAELAARVTATGQFESIIERHKIHTIERNEIVNRYFPKEICHGKDIDLFRWLLLPEKYTGAAFERLAYAHGVQVFPAEKFAVGKTLPLHAVRLSICATKTLEELEVGMQTLAGLLK